MHYLVEGPGTAPGPLSLKGGMFTLKARGGVCFT